MMKERARAALTRTVITHSGGESEEHVEKRNLIPWRDMLVMSMSGKAVNVFHPFPRKMVRDILCDYAGAHGRDSAVIRENQPASMRKIARKQSVNPWGCVIVR